MNQKTIGVVIAGILYVVGMFFLALFTGTRPTVRNPSQTNNKKHGGH